MLLTKAEGPGSHHAAEELREQVAQLQAGYGFSLP